MEVVMKNLDNKKESVLTCDNTIITATARAVSFMHFHPPLAYNRRNAMDSLYYFDSQKIFLAFSKPFWSEPNKLPIIPYNSSTQQNGASAIGDDLTRLVRKFI